MQPAVFFDRDGTLIVDKHYMHIVDEIEYFNDCFSALKKLRQNQIQIFIVTNQSGIGRGIFDETQMQAIHIKMLEDFKHHNIDIQDIAHCPHSPDDNCDCRKPSGKLIKKLANEHQIDLAQSYMVGDKISDAQAGKNAGCTGLLLNTQAVEFQSFESLTQIVDHILSRRRKNAI